MKRVSLLSLLGLSLVACRGGGGGGGDDVDAPTQIHIQDVQNAAMAKGTPVSLKGVVVTAIDTFGARTGDMWVEEPGGGEFSGIKIFGAPLDVVATLKAGDIVDITNAEKDEFALTSDSSGRTATELKGAGGGQMQMTKTGSGAVPAASMVDALAISKLATATERDAEWEKWEGVLINVVNARQEGAVGTFGTNPDQKSFDATGGLVVETVLADFPAISLPGVCYSGMSGIGDYFFDYLLLPRASGDLADGGNGCAAQTVATISEVQAGTATGSVIINDVFVTGIGFGNAATPARNFWISSSLTAAPNEGLFVFGNKALDATVVVGAKVSIIATVKEFNDDQMGGSLTELTSPTVTVQAGTPGTTVAVTGKTATDLLVAGTAPTFESVLVKLTNVNITALGTTTNGFVASATQAGTNFGVGTDIIRLVAGQLGCYTEIVGFWTNLEAAGNGATTKPNAFGFIPLTLGATGTGCN